KLKGDLITVHTKTFSSTSTGLSNHIDSCTDGEVISFIGLNASLGGYVFYVTPDGTHGLVAATQDQSSSSEWYLAQDVISNPANHNTDGKKFTDWRLPTKYELNLIYTQKTAIGDFVNNYYWSSVENGSAYAWLQNFGNGSQDYGPKDGTYNVRAVRTF
ncbi:MAG: DUF1566 domain-containing protein, partial [Desulfobacterales bacterium]|nr:DUF1566 domain-containing protein [Desulfobacterales bacterium]